MTPLRGLGPVAVLLPVKAFGEAKRRLAPALDPADRAALERAAEVLERLLEDR